MTEIDHASRQHSPIGPSSMNRTLACPAWVRFCKGIENKSTVFALEGTAAHEFNEFILSNSLDPSDYLDGVVVLDAKGNDRFKKEGLGPDVDRKNVFAIGQEMIDGCELYRDTINQYLVEGSELELEQRLDMRHIHPLLFGTGDALVYDPKTRRLIVLDYKFGRGYAVDVLDNPQLLSYAVGAAHRLHDRGVDTVTLVVVQPRAYHHDGPVRAQTFSVIDLDFFVEDLREGTHATDDPEAPFCAGEHCRFCPGAYACDSYRDHVLELTGGHLDENGTFVMPDPTSLSIQQLGVIVRNAVILEAFTRRAMQFAHDEAVNGRIPEGTKLAAKRAYRKWINAEDIPEVLTLMGLDESDFLSEPKLLSPAAVEKKIGKKAAAKLLDGLFNKLSTGVVLTVLEDPRESANPPDGSEFGSVE